MKHKTTFYHLQSATMSPCLMGKGFDAEVQDTWSCQACLTPKESYKSIDVHIQELVPADPPLNFIHGGPAVVRKDFLEELGMDVVYRDLYVGRLFGPKEYLIEDWVTFRGRHRLIIRGTTNVSHRRCSECGRMLYFAMGKRYLYPMPPHDADIFESDLYGLVVREHIFSRVNLDRWPMVTTDALSVPREPKDSLGVLA